MLMLQVLGEEDRLPLVVKHRYSGISFFSLFFPSCCCFVCVCVRMRMCMHAFIHDVFMCVHECCSKSNQTLGITKAFFMEKKKREKKRSSWLGLERSTWLGLERSSWLGSERSTWLGLERSTWLGLGRSTWLGLERSSWLGLEKSS